MQSTNNNNFMYKQNQNIALVGKNGLTTLITIYQAKTFAPTNNLSFDNIKFPPAKTRIKKYRT